MIKGKESILSWIKDNDLTEWRIRASASGDIIFTNPSYENPTVDDALNTLEPRLNYLEPGTYYLEGWRQGLSRNAWYKTRISINGSGLPAEINGLRPVHTPEDINLQIARALDEYKMKQENELLRAENIELKTKYDAVLMRILERAEPYIGTILAGLFPGQAAPAATAAPQSHISGTQTNNNKKMSQTELTARAERALEKWYGIDPDAVILLEKISTIAINNPELYKTAKNILLTA
jgi:hypothetical protein